MAENVNEHKVIFSADIADIKGKLQELQKAMQDAGVVTATAGNQMANSMGASMAKIGSSLSSLGTSLSVGLTAPLLLLGKSALQTSAQMEQISVSFEVFTGSAETAKEMLGQLKDQAIKSPMQFQDITKGAQTLLGYGLTASQVIPITRMLGDVSGGNADKFSRLSLAFGQVNAAGRLMGQEARQMINAGFNPLQAIADKTGVSMAVLTKRMHDGQISVKDVGDAFIYATSEGGRFFGMADRQSQTLQGSFNKLQESAKFALGEIGTAINQELNVGSGLREFAGFINELKDRFMQLTPEAKEMNLKLIAIGISIGPIILSIGSLISFVNKLSVSLASLSLSGGGIAKILITLAATFLATKAAGAMYDDVMDSAIKKDPALLKDVNERLKEQIKNYDELIKKAPKIGFAEIDEASNQSKYIKGKSELMAERFKLYKQYADNTILIRNLEKNVKATDKVTGLSATPPKLKPDKEEKIEIIPGIDFQTKEYGNKLKALIKENQEAGMVINAWWKDNDLKRLDELIKDYKVKKALADKEGIDIFNITKKYEDAKNAIMFDSANKKVDFREKARARIMVVGPDLRVVSDAQKIQNAIDKVESSDMASRLETLGQALYSAQSDFANNLAVGFAEIAGSVLSGGMTIQDSFAALGALVLNATGDYLVKAGSAAIAAGLVKALFKNALNPAGSATELILGGIAAVSAGTAMKQFGSAVSSSVKSKPIPSATGGAMPSTSVSSKASGSSYQYGGSSYATQSVRLMVDLTGSITATQSGYSINKSLETTLRVTGR
jgi:tape measure domain-containing protein